MVSESGESFPVPANYASKSMLVVGDTLKLVEEGKNKDKRFKQIEHVKRHKSTGILTKKEGKWRAVTPEGSYKVLPAAVEHFGADIGSEVMIHLPATNLTVGYAAIESVKNNGKPEAVNQVEEVFKPQETKDTSVVNESKTKPIKEESHTQEVKHAAQSDHKNSDKPKNEVKKAPEPKKEPKRVESQPAKKVEAPKPSPVVATEHKAIVVPAPPPPAPLVQSNENEVIVAPTKIEGPVATETAKIEVSPEEDELL